MMFRTLKYISYAAMAIALVVPQIPAFAQDLPAMTWSDRIAKETSDGSIVETPPMVKIGSISLSRFSQMQSLSLHDTLDISKGDDVERLFVFRAWQGGASQGEQLILVTVSSSGVDIIGPHNQGFETMTIKTPANDVGPVFELYGAKEDKPIARLEYFSGQLIEIN